MASNYLILTAADRRWLKGLRISAGEVMDEKLATFADCLDQKQKLAQLQQFVERGWDLESDAAQ
jgi:hypothetical protein